MSVATWRKCDFQLHTCRDPSWEGARALGIGDQIPGTDQIATLEDVRNDREKWADNFVSACISAELQAIAVTDHHETTMIPHIRTAIERAKLADPKVDLWLFPGMELTAKNGYQCLILFDQEIEEQWLIQAQGSLGIAHASIDQNSNKSPRVTQLASEYDKLSECLDQFDELVGRYIILPNVSDGRSKHSVLKDGHHGSFRAMPYVGAYLDNCEQYESLRTQSKKRLSGNEKIWSEREIYPISTSDARNDRFDKVGKNNAWIKLASPTAEAIRQAFLAHKSRIRTAPPSLPEKYIQSITIRNSNILSNLEVEFSPQLNSIIGGRGSGKSSLLEYIAFGLGLSTLDTPQREDTYAGAKRLKKLVSSTLIEAGAEVILRIVQDGAVFEVTRGPDTAHKPRVKYPSGQVEMVSEKELRSLFPSVVYAQGELSELGNDASKKSELSDLLKFVNEANKTEDDRLKREIEYKQSAIGDELRKVVKHWKYQAECREKKTKREALVGRVAALEKMLPEMSDTDRAVVEAFTKAEKFEVERQAASKHLRALRQEISSTLSSQLHKRDVSAGGFEEADSFAKQYEKIYASVASSLNRLSSELTTWFTELESSEAAWSNKLDQLTRDRNDALAKLTSHKNVTSQIITLKEEVARLEGEIAELESKLNSETSISEKLYSEMATLKGFVDERASKTMSWAADIESLSDGTISTLVDVQGDTLQLSNAIEALSAGTGSKEATRVQKLADLLKERGFWNLLDTLRAETIAALHWKTVGTVEKIEKPDTPTIREIIGMSESVGAQFYDKLDELRAEAIFSTFAKPKVSLFYCDDGTKLPFDSASEGQRAAALLIMLLKRSGGPLLVDQPEGDLDNSIISNVTDILHSAKEGRQILFVSHNANMVVNGSSELVVVMSPTEERKRTTKFKGAIDDNLVRNEITSTMEGGHKAFKDRQEKYGF